jgi:transcription elongation factor Elf1
MDFEHLFHEQDASSLDLEFTCHDCGAAVRVTAARDDQGVVLTPRDGAAGYYPQLNSGEKEYFVKCALCYQAQPRLTRFNPTEVYTRIVGYYRPVNQWNRGKKEEYRHRKLFEQSQVDTVSNL